MTSIKVHFFNGKLSAIRSTAPTIDEAISNAIVFIAKQKELGVDTMEDYTIEYVITPTKSQ